MQQELLENRRAWAVQRRAEIAAKFEAQQQAKGGARAGGQGAAAAMAGGRGGAGGAFSAARPRTSALGGRPGAAMRVARPRSVGGARQGSSAAFLL